MYAVGSWPAAAIPAYEGIFGTGDALMDLVLAKTEAVFDAIILAVPAGEELNTALEAGGAGEVDGGEVEGGCDGLRRC